MKRVLIIAEAGVNHNGSLQRAKEMIVAAKEAGADFIKFQTSIPEKTISRFAQKANYQKVNTGTTESQLEMLRKLVLPVEDFKVLRDYCNEVGIRFMSTPFCIDAVDILAALDVEYMKVPSGEITNLPYLRKIARTGIPVIMSSGMCKLGEVEDALAVLTENGLSTDQIVLLHCNTEYPTPMQDVNLRSMLTLRDSFGVHVGYSDHTQGIEVPIAAVAMGAEVIEKHFTLDRTLPGPDHIASLEPMELKSMVDAIRNIEKALGTGIKQVSASEKKNIAIARKSIVAAYPLKKGDVFTEDNLTVKRPGTGISPMRWDEVIGQIAKRDFSEDEQIEL